MRLHQLNQLQCRSKSSVSRRDSAETRHDLVTPVWPQTEEEEEEEPTPEEHDVQYMELDTHLKAMCKLFSLGVAYSASVGGNATMMGQTTNLVYKGMLDEWVLLSHNHAGSECSHAMSECKMKALLIVMSVL